MTDTNKPNKVMNRRELLKALAATGGAVTAATMLPGKWTKPAIEAGVLPAHAATSALVISGFNVQGVGNLGEPPVGEPPVVPMGSFEYSDGLGGVNGNTVLHLKVEVVTGDATGLGLSPIVTATFGDIDAAPPPNDVDGDGFSGTVTFSFDELTPLNSAGGNCTPQPIDFRATIYIENEDGRISNTDADDFTIFQCLPG